MGRAVASAVVAGPVSEVEALWYDVNRWPTFVDGFAAVVERDDVWPREGGRLTWDSTPHGRGRVVERVTAYEPQGGQSVEFHDDQLAGRQRVAFQAEADGAHTRVTLSIEYRIQERTPLTPLLDLLFVRRALNDALRRTVARFARERLSEIELS